MEFHLTIGGMSCTACSAAVEAALRKTPGLTEVQVSYTLAEAKIQANSPQVAQLAIEAIKKAGYSASLTPAEQHVPSPVWPVLLALGFTLPVFISGMFFHSSPLTPFIGLLFSTPVIWLGRSFFQRAFLQIRKGRPAMDTLVGISTGVSYVYSISALAMGHTEALFFEAAAMVISFVMLGKWLEEKARHKTLAGIRSLIQLMPSRARLYPDANWVELAQLKQQDLIMVAAGDEIPADAQVESGQMEVDASWLSGESIPLLARSGDAVFAGSAVVSGNAVLRITAIGDSSRLGQTLAQVKKALVTNLPMQRLADALSAKFVLFIIAFAIGSAGLWLFLAPETPAIFALQVGLTVLAVACPCALGLAVPTVISVALGKAAQKGIFFQRPEALESLAQVRRIFMDKTGTLTEGNPNVLWTNAVLQEHAAVVWELASISQHPLSKSLANWAKHSFPNFPKSPITQISEVPGFGLEGIWDGKEIRLGAPNWAGPWPAEIPMDASPVILGNGQVTYAAFLLQDAPRPNVLAIMKQLIHLGLIPIVLTGDRTLSSAVRDVLPPQVQVHLHQQPEDKIRAIERAKSEGEVVLMVGDGINDAPALALANIGISMGEGSYLARQCSHISLGDSNLDLLPEAIRISKQAVRLMRQNMLWALSYNLVALPLAAGILYPFTGHLFNPMWAGMAMAASSVFVVLNSLRLSFS